MRAALIMIVAVVASATSAAADTDLVVLGPAALGKVSDARLSSVKALLDRAAIAPPVTRVIDAACAGDSSCLVTAGNELGARRVLAVTVAEPSPGHVAIGFSLVDVIGKELVATRTVTFAVRKLGPELGRAIAKFLDEAPIERAKVLFAEGNQHFSLGELDQALELYKRAYRIKPLPAFLFNIAQCQRKLGHHQEAITMYQSYLVGVPDAPNKPLVESLIAESKAALVADQKRDEDRAAAAAKIEAERLATEAKRAEESRKAKEAEAVTAFEQRKAAQARIAAERDLERRYDRHPARVWSMIAGGVGAAALVTGGVFGVKERNAQAAFDAAGCGDPTRLLGAQAIAACQSDRDRGQRDAALGNSFLIGGGALLLGAVLVFALDPGNVERPDPPRAQVSVSPSSVQVVLSW